MMMSKKGLAWRVLRKVLRETRTFDADAEVAIFVVAGLCRYVSDGVVRLDWAAYRLR